MRLRFTSAYHLSVFQAQKQFKKERPKAWEEFCKSVPVFLALLHSMKSHRLALFFTNIRYRRILKDSQREYTYIWEKNSSNILSKLEKLFGYELDGSYKGIICVSPVYIRDIDRKLFLAPAGAERDRIVEIIIHELSHFFFYKNRDIYGSYADEAFWLLSEQIVPYLLDMQFQDLCFRAGEPYYPEPSDVRAQIIEAWLQGTVTFEELVKRCLSEGQNGGI